MKTLIELYKSILASVGMTADGQGFVSTLLPGSDTPKPFSVESKRLVLPTEEQLKMTDWSNRIGFHPLLQNLTGGESRVMEKFRDRMNGYSDFMLGMLMVDIGQLAVKKDMHKDLSPVQAAYLGPFSDADEKFVKLLTDLVAAKRVTKKNFEFVRFSVIKGRIWQGQKRSRVAVMHFPLYEALPKENKPTTILGFKLRVADVKMLRAMYEFLFTAIREPGHYEVGSDSKVAPSLEALMALYAMFIDVQNQAVSILEPVIATSNALLIVNDWRDDLQKVEHYLPEIRKIPLLEGNAPSERVAQPHAPQRISDTPLRPTVQVDTAPTIPATVKIGTSAPAQPVGTSAPSQPVQQEIQSVTDHQQTGAPRFRLGVKAPTVDHVTHSVPSSINESNLSYARPSPLPVTPPVGTILAEQRAETQPQFRQPVQPQFQQPTQPQAPQAMKVPETARLINGALYIPVEGSGVSGVPQGAVLVDGKVYIPLAGAMGGGTMQGGNVLPGQGATFNPQAGRFGMQQQITDPSQVPGLSPDEVAYFRSNPVMFQNYLAQHYAQSTQMAQNVLTQRQTQIPRYLQRAAAEAQQQSQFTAGGFFGRR